MRLLVVTDAWRPQVNGVVRTLERLAEALGALGVETEFLSPEGYRTAPLPTYPEVRMAMVRPREVARRIRQGTADSIHLATEGPLGIMARRFCLANGMQFTTSYHTRFPEFVRARLPIPESWSYRWLRRFHNAGQGMMVATPSLRAEMIARGFDNVRLWERGVDVTLFNPSHRRELDLPRPVFLNVGRVAVEKNLPAFLDLDLPGSKVVVGDGPDLAALRQRYPDVHFRGTLQGEDLAAIYASADVFVFPSRTDTFGNVILEAMASGTPVAAFPVTGPIDILGGKGCGVLCDDLGRAALAALAIPRDAPRMAATAYEWRHSAHQFLDNLAPVSASRPIMDAAGLALNSSRTGVAT